MSSNTSATVEPLARRTGVTITRTAGVSVFSVGTITDEILEEFAVVAEPEGKAHLLLPRAERQLLRLIAHRVLEEAPELASVELQHPMTWT